MNKTLISFILFVGGLDRLEPRVPPRPNHSINETHVVKAPESGQNQQ